MNRMAKIKDDKKIQVVHNRLDLSPFFNRLRKNKLPAVSYKTYLVCRSILYTALERQISQSKDARIQRIWGPNSFKQAWLLKQMQLLHVAMFPVIEPAVRMSLQLAAEIATQDAPPSSSISLLGYLYELENFQIHARSSLRDLLRKINALSLDEEDQRTFTSASEAAKVVLEKVTDALVTFRPYMPYMPYINDQLKFHICSVNPEAGSHATPQNPQEIEVALRAASRSFRKFPYLKERYGERGERFTASDSCWLVALIPLELEVIQKSVSWLRTILAKRGLPSLILESHMEDIIQIFQELIPERKNCLENFMKVAIALKTERGRAVGKEPFNQSQETALLASAQADERAGIQGALEAVQSWFANPERAQQKREAS